MLWFVELTRNLTANRFICGRYEPVRLIAL